MRNEKEMIPVLTEYLNNNMGYSIIANELDSGYGIADIVATIDSQEHHYYAFKHLIDVFLLESFPFNKTILFEDICKMTSYSEKHLKYVVLKGFIEGGFLEKTENGYKRVKKLTTKRNPIIAVEAKIKKWRNAFLQAIRYKKYADFCYVALPEKAVKNVNLTLFKENNIGVLAVSSSKSVFKVLNSRQNKEKNDLYAIYVNGILYKDRQTGELDFSRD